MNELEFQDHPYEASGGDKASPSAPPEHTIEFSDFPPDATQVEGDESPTTGTKDSKAAPSIFSLAYYQQFFDVDTVDVGSRVLWSMVPNPKRNLLEHVIRPKPDLYGPFWVCVTLTFCIAITGNVADFFETSGRSFKWVYDYNKVPLAATAVFGYWLIIPVGVWAILRWRGSLAGYTLTELICVYGYSLAIFIPCSILWLIPSPTVQFLVAVVCSLLSGATLLITLYPAVKNDSKQVMMIFMVIVIVLHALLATGFVMYFFRYDSSLMKAKTPLPAAITANASLEGKDSKPRNDNPIKYKSLYETNENKSSSTHTVKSNNKKKKKSVSTDTDQN